jgi:hypothetical protein
MWRDSQTQYCLAQPFKPSDAAGGRLQRLNGLSHFIPLKGRQPKDSGPAGQAP